MRALRLVSTNGSDRIVYPYQHEVEDSQLIKLVDLKIAEWTILKNLLVYPW